LTVFVLIGLEVTLLRFIKREGKLDQAVGKVKEKAENTMDKIRDALTEQ
jgi:hypothetical protein